MEISASELNDMLAYLTDDDTDRKEKTKDFIQKNTSPMLNMAVTMYMVDALHCLSDLSLIETKRVAFELAMLGMEGINTQRQDYQIPSFPDREFSGYKTLSYYYVSWKMLMPSLSAHMLDLPFHKEYRLAQQISGVLHG